MTISGQWEIQRPDGNVRALAAGFRLPGTTKFVDKATPKLLLETFSGKITPTIVLTLKKPESDATFMTITLTDAIVTSISPAGSAGQDRQMEHLTISFKEVSFQYTELDQQGSPKGNPPVTGGWNIDAGHAK